MSTRKLSRSLVKAAITAQETATHCNATITARMPILFGGTAEAASEWNRAYTEKVAASWEGAFAAAAEWQAAMIRSALRAPTPLTLADDVLRVIHKAGHPARRRAKANAKRLGKPSSRKP